MSVEMSISARGAASSQILGQLQVLGQVGAMPRVATRLTTEAVGEMGGVGGGHSTRMMID